MRCLLTGATGFLGAAVARRLVERGHTVAGVSRSGADRSRLGAVADRVAWIEGSLDDVEAFGGALKAFAPDAVIHSGWTGVAGADRNAPSQFRNVETSARLAELAGAAGCRTFIGIGSQAEYGQFEGPVAESAPTRPSTYYGIAKLGALQATERACERSGMRWAWLRVFSLYGPRDHASWLIPFLIARVMRGEKPSLTGCEQTWDFLHVDDAAAAVVAVVESDAASGVFNLAAGVAPPLRETVCLLRDMVDPKVPLGIGEVPYASGQVMRFEADVARLRQATGWLPERDLAEGLRETIEWIRAQAR